MSDMGTKEAAALWGVSQRTVANWCRNTADERITQDKKGSPYISRRFIRIHLQNKINHQNKIYFDK